jgi:MFS superfamily sulfate permease-like transporter
MNADIGAKTQMASLVCSSVVLLFTFFLLPTMYYLPRCVLASMLVVYTWPLSLHSLCADVGEILSICLVVFTLLAEVPHDVAYYWKWVVWSSSPLTGAHPASVLEWKRGRISL